MRFYNIKLFNGSARAEELKFETKNFTITKHEGYFKINIEKKTEDGYRDLLIMRGRKLKNVKAAAVALENAFDFSVDFKNLMKNKDLKNYTFNMKTWLES